MGTKMRKLTHPAFESMAWHLLEIPGNDRILMAVEGTRRSFA